MKIDHYNITEVIEVQPDGIRGMYGGAYTLAFMYSNKGNILFKGYMREIETKLKKEYSDRKYFVVFNLYSKEYKRTIIHFSNGKSISTPDSVRWDARPKGSKDFKYSIFLKNGKRIWIKRLPKSWTPAMQQIFSQT